MIGVESKHLTAPTADARGTASAAPLAAPLMYTETAPPRRLLWPVDHVAADESLIGLLFRTVSENLHRTIAHAMLAAGSPHDRWFNLAEDPSVDTQRVGWVLRLPESEIEKRCHPVVDTVDRAPCLDFFGATIPAYDLVFRTRRVAPAALRASAHHRATATHGLLPFCLDTGQMLMDRCPACDFRLDWYHTAGMTRCGHPDCTFELDTAEGVQLDAKIFHSASRIARLLDPRPEIHEAARAALPRELAELDRGVTFELAWRLGCVALTGGVQERDRHKNLHPEQIVARLAAGAEMATGWPGSPAELIRARIAEGDPAALLERIDPAAGGLYLFDETSQVAAGDLDVGEGLRDHRVLKRGQLPQSRQLANAVAGNAGGFGDLADWNPVGNHRPEWI